MYVNRPDPYSSTQFEDYLRKLLQNVNALIDSNNQFDSSIMLLTNRVTKLEEMEPVTLTAEMKAELNKQKIELETERLKLQTEKLELSRERIELKKVMDELPELIRKAVKEDDINAFKKWLGQKNLSS